MKLSIKDNNCVITEPCGICKKEFEPELGLAIFSTNDYTPICENCAKENDFEIYSLWLKREK